MKDYIHSTNCPHVHMKPLISVLPKKFQTLQSGTNRSTKAFEINWGVFTPGSFGAAFFKIGSIFPDMCEQKPQLDTNINKKYNRMFPIH